MAFLPNTKGTKIYSIANLKCPVCQEGDLFISKNPFHPKKFDKMNERCSHCNHKHELESGFFYGAMYVSYGITVAISVAVFMATYVLFPAAEYINYIVNILIALIVFMPISFRFSRAVWSNLFSSYCIKKGFNS